MTVETTNPYPFESPTDPGRVDITEFEYLDTLEIVRLANGDDAGMPLGDAPHFILARDYRVRWRDQKPRLVGCR